MRNGLQELTDGNAKLKLLDIEQTNYCTKPTVGQQRFLSLFCCFLMHEVRDRNGCFGRQLWPWLPDGYSQVFRSYVFRTSGFLTMAPLR